MHVNAFTRPTLATPFVLILGSLIAFSASSSTAHAATEVRCSVSASLAEQTMDETSKPGTGLKDRALGELEPQTFATGQPIQYERETRDVKVVVTSGNSKKNITISLENLRTAEIAEWDIHPSILKSDAGATLHLVTPEGIRSTRNAREVTLRCFAR